MAMLHPINSQRSRVRVLVVDDSAFMRTALTRMIASESEFEVVGTACCGWEALEKISRLDPDIITLDLQMPGLDGMETLRRIMLQRPRLVIVVSGSVNQSNTAFAARALGAFECVSKNLSPNSLEIGHIRQDLITKLRAAAHSLPERPRSRMGNLPHMFAGAVSDHTTSASEIVAIGASTGGPHALEEILPRLPADFPAPILIVQHMPYGFTTSLADRLNQLSSITVREAIHGETLRPGVAYLAPAGQHMTIQGSDASNIRISLDREPVESLHIPSVDLMMKSVAQIFTERTLGVILTGMGNDGAEGIRAIHLYGGITFGQDERTCVVFGMPRACAEGGLLTSLVPVSQIPDRILQAVQPRNASSRVVWNAH